MTDCPLAWIDAYTLWAIGFLCGSVPVLALWAIGEWVDERRRG